MLKKRLIAADDLYRLQTFQMYELRLTAGMLSIVYSALIKRPRRNMEIYSLSQQIRTRSF